MPIEPLEKKMYSEGKKMCGSWFRTPDNKESGEVAV